MTKCKGLTKVRFLPLTKTFKHFKPVKLSNSDQARAYVLAT